jgi:glycosyltransferase involved in cell wall biosynthesis
MTSPAMATSVFDAASKIPALNRQRGLRGLALNIHQRKRTLAALLAAADAVTAPSNHLRQTLQRSGVAREIRVIQSGHDLSWLAAGAQKSISRRVRFGYIGQFIPTKGVHVLLEAFGGQNWQGRAELHLFGNPDSNPAYYQSLQQHANDNPGALFFHGPFAHEKLGEILAGLDVLVVPSSWHENNPRVIQEAFAGKTPVIASDVGGIAEYVQHEVNGLLFRRDDSADLRAQLARLVENPAQIAQFTAHLPTVKTMADEMDEIEAVYRQIVHL